MYISVLRWSQGCREIIFQMWKQKRLRVIAEKFFRRFAWSRRHTFSYLWNFDRCRLSDPGSRHQSRSRRRIISCDRVNVNKPKLWNFDRLLGLPCHLHEVINVSHMSSLRNTTVRVRGNCHCRQPRNHSRNRADVKAEGARDICRISMDH